MNSQPVVEGVKATGRGGGSGSSEDRGGRALSRQCSGVKRDGGRCTHTAKGASGFCHLHDPARADERKANASRAGRSSGNQALRKIRSEVRTLIGDVIKGDVPSSRGAVALQGYNVLLRAEDLERKVRELDELEARIEALEASREGGEDRRAG